MRDTSPTSQEVWYGFVYTNLPDPNEVELKIGPKPVPGSRHYDRTLTKHRDSAGNEFWCDYASLKEDGYNNMVRQERLKPLGAVGRYLGLGYIHYGLMQFNPPKTDEK